ncbi:MAG: heavy metal sensor histidine kinase [Planctomycetota bacterium]
MFLKKILLKNKWFKSLGWKLTLWYMVLFLVLSSILSLCLYQRLKVQLNEEVDFFLADEMNEFDRFVTEHQDNFPLIEQQMQKESLAIRKNYQMYYSILDKAGITVLQSSELKLSTPGINIVKSSLLSNYDVKEYEIYHGKNKDVVRMITEKFQGQNEFISYLQVGMNLTRIEKTLLNFRRNIAVILPVFFILSCVGGLFLSRRNLRPISQMIDTVSRISAFNLKEKVPVRGADDELDKLAHTFNNMIGRISQAYQKLIQFSSDAAHELRTPLTVLIGEIESVTSRESSFEEYHAVLMSGLEELLRLERLVNNLLFLSRGDNSLRVRCTELIKLNATVLDISELFAPVAEENKISFSTDVISDALYVQGEKWQIEQLISNLLDNAIRYNRPGGSIVVSLQRAGNYAEIIIRDTGVGLSEENREKIFDRFYRVDSSRARHSGGIGLGLSIVKSVIEAHSGEILVKSKTGEGSIFTVKLPLQQIHTPVSTSPFYTSVLKID